MALVAEKKTGVIKAHQVHKKDTGSSQVQIALLTERIAELTEHFKRHPKDTNSRRGLLMMVGHRSALLKYLAKHQPSKYQEIIKKLGIRK
ncbi:MAG: 30S ribosomal protein S15 [Planctomycetes bacterium]|jgi:small subunit ribosomal protein S15|nr:30S ribosomal protein S15 [Planctomycetota bacterium]